MICQGNRHQPKTKNLPTIDGIVDSLHSTKNTATPCFKRHRSAKSRLQPLTAESQKAAGPAPDSLIVCLWHPLHRTCNRLLLSSGLREKDDEVCQALDWDSERSIDHADGLRQPLRSGQWLNLPLHRPSLVERSAA